VQHLPRTGDEVEGTDVVDRQPDAADQRADSTSGQVADDADARRGATQRRQAIRVAASTASPAMSIMVISGPFTFGCDSREALRTPLGRDLAEEAGCT
jgi:hypothetical protein